MSNPYCCSHCHNEGYDHAADCPFHPDNLALAAHTDPEFYQRFAFCRIDCEECDRLDRKERAEGVTQSMVERSAMVLLASAITEGGMDFPLPPESERKATNSSDPGVHEGTEHAPREGESSD